MVYFSDGYKSYISFDCKGNNTCNKILDDEQWIEATIRPAKLDDSDAAHQQADDSDDWVVV